MRLRFIALLILLLLITPNQAQENLPVIIEPEPSVVVGGHLHVVGVKWNPEGTILAVGTNQGILLLDENLEEQDLLKPAEGHPNSGLFRWSPDGRFIAMGYGLNIIVDLSRQTGDTAYIWDTETGAMISSFSHPFNSPAFLNITWSNNSDALMMFVSDRDENDIKSYHLIIWERDSNLYTINDISQYTDTDALPDIPGRKEIIWSTNDSQIHLQLTNATEALNLTFLRDGTFIDQQIISFDPYVITSPDGRYIATLEPSENSTVTLSSDDSDDLVFSTGTSADFAHLIRVIWSASGQYVAIASPREPILIVVDMQLGEPILEITEHGRNFVGHVAFHPNADSLTISHYLEGLYHYELPSAELITRKWLNSLSVATEMSPDGSIIARVNSIHPFIYLSDAVTGEELTLLEIAPDIEPRVSLHSLAWSPNGRYLAAGSRQDSETNDSRQTEPYNIIIWDMTTHEIAYTIPVEGYIADFIANLSWSADSNRLAWTTRSGQSGRTFVGAWERSSDTILYQEARSAVYSIAPHPSQSVVILPDYDFDTSEVYLMAYNLNDQSETMIEVQSDPIYAVSWHPSGEQFVLIQRPEENLQASFWDWDASFLTATNSFTIDLPFEPPFFERSLHWSADGNLLAIGYDDAVEKFAGVAIFEVDLRNQTAIQIEDYRLTHLSDNPYTGIPNFAWSADNSTLVVNFPSGPMVIWER